MISSERDLGQIVFRVVVDDLHFLAFAHHFSDLEQCDVSAVFRVVELAIRVPLDKPSWLVGRCRCWRMIFGCRVHSRSPGRERAAVAAALRANPKDTLL